MIIWAAIAVALATGPAMPQAGVQLVKVDLSVVAKGYRMSKLIHTTVINDKNEKIGKIGDLIVTPDGTLSLAVVDVGGFLGMGRHRVAIPVGQFSDVKPKVVLPGATKDALKQLPEFEYAKS